MLKLYGNPRSRALRCLWMLEEVGQPYQLVDKSLRADDLHSADYLRLNPNARIPTLVDGDVVLWESMAFDPKFFVDWPKGQRPHQVRLQGGDCSSDSYCYP